MGQGNHDYAHELFSQCVIADPGNVVYTQTCMANLIQKHGEKKKGLFGGLKNLGSKGGVKKASMQKDWPGVLKAGLAVLKENPWDTTNLLAMADACEQLGYEDSQVAYLRAALKFNPEDLHINRQCAIALRERKEFDAAIACWQRILKAKPKDEEATRAVGAISAEKTIHKGGYETAESSRDVKKKSVAGVQREELSPEQQLQRQIKKNPNEKAAYLELFQIYQQSDRFQPAEEILQKARALFPDDADILHKYEEIQLRNLRDTLAAAEKEAARTNDAEVKERVVNLRKELKTKELEYYERLVERFPSNASYRFRLGQKYQTTGQTSDAIKQFQQAKNDPKHHGVCLLELGKCFQVIKQYKLAATHYAEAIQAISDQDEANKKDALYLATKLAIGLKDYDLADEYAQNLAAMDFGYKDVAELLDKIAQNRQD